MATYKIGDKLDRSKLGATLVEPSELFALKWGKTWAPAYRGGWSTKDDGSGPVNVQAINIGNEAQIYLTEVGRAAFPSMNDVMKSDGPQGPLRITPRRMTAAERAQINTRPQLSSQTWVSGAPTSLVDIVLPYYAEIKCDIPVKPDGTFTAIWTAFWQMLADLNWNVGTGGPEFDIMEMFGRDKTPRITTGYHAPGGKAWSTLDPETGKLIGGSLKALIDTGAIPGAIEYIGTGSASQNMNVPFGVHTYGGWADASGFYTFVDDVCKWIWPVDPAAVNRKINIAADFAIGTGDTGAGNIGPNETSVGTWTIYDMRVSAIGGATPTPVPTPVPTPTPTQTITTTSTVPTTASGSVPVAGGGTGNLNVVVFKAAADGSPDWTAKLSADVKPDSRGRWSLSIDSTKLPAGASQVVICGFSTLPNIGGGTMVSKALTMNVKNTAPPPVGGPTDAQKAALALVAADEADYAAKKAAVASAQTAADAALDKWQTDVKAALTAFGVP